MYFDAHCHLTDERFADDIGSVIERARDAGVARMVTIASDPDDAVAARDLARRHDGIWTSAGVHPHAAGSVDADVRARITDLTQEPEVVAIGETGLDYHYETFPRNVQRASFAWHLELAAERDLPVVVHSREADADVMAAIRVAEGVRGVLHCFTGGAALLETALAAGWYVSFAGLVSFHNFKGADLVRAVPDDRILVETDSPYLAPVPHRGKRNEPAYLPEVVKAVARIRGVDATELARQTTRNASIFYRLES